METRPIEHEIQHNEPEMPSWIAYILDALVLVVVPLYGLVVGIKYAILRACGRKLLARTLAARSKQTLSGTLPRLTFVCPMTKPRVLNRFFKAGINDLDETAAAIFHDNSGPTALVAAKLFNHLINQVDTEYVAFCHQDWRPIDRDWIAQTLNVFAQNPDCEMVAQIGVAEDKESLGGGILDPHGRNGRQVSVRLHAPDEQCFVVRAETLRRLPFDEAALPEFHFYAVDYAVELYRRGHETWSTPALAYHHSAAGALTSKSFKRAREVLRAKYGPNTVRATTGWI